MTHEIVIVNSVMALGSIYQNYCKPKYTVKQLSPMIYTIYLDLQTQP